MAEELVKNEHYPVSIFYDLIGMGWRIECACGEVTAPCQFMQEVGAEMDDHMEPAEEQHGVPAIAR